MKVRSMRGEDVPFAVALTDQEGWGYDRQDFLRFMRMDPRGTLVAWSDGERVGITTATSYGVTAWIGNVIVVPAGRGKGYGRGLMEAALAYCQEEGAESVWLNAYTQVVGFYEGLGFAETGRTGRYQGEAHGTLRPEARLTHRGELEDLAAIDAPLFGADRGKVLRAFYHDYGDAFFVWDEEGVRGFGVGAGYQGGVDVAPLVAPPGQPEVGEGLLDHLLAVHAGSTVGLAVPHENAPALAALKDRGFQQAFETVRMVRGPPAHGIDPRGVWALGGLEKG